MDVSVYEEDLMKLTPPKKVTFIAAFVFFVLGVLAAFIPALHLTGFAVWLCAIAYLVLALGNTAKGL